MTSWCCDRTASSEESLVDSNVDPRIIDNVLNSDLSTS